MSLVVQKSSAVDRWLPIGLFISFFMAIVVATIYYAPSWGLMDDFGLLQMAREFKANPQHVQVVSENFITSGMLRPFYYTWAAVFYGIFENSPTVFYIFIAACNMLAMVFWGLVFFNLFGIRKEDRFWTVFFYPLTFFIFTPFWNIFNYLSLQEKFVVFFAPLAIYFFQKLYRKFDQRDLVWLYLCVFCGLMSKATFVYVPFIFFVYALLDLLIFNYRPKTSWLLVWINGLIFAAYAIFTLTFQIQGNYTAKYKSGLSGGAFLGKIFGLPVVMKSLFLVGIAGLVGITVYALSRRRQDLSLGIMIYAALIAYIALLIPWGFQSYLISAIGPLALGGLFPVYAWLNAKGGAVKCLINAVIIVLLCFVFVGNIIPNISRMGDMGRAIAFLKGHKGSSADTYFMPPGYTETADATNKFTKKNVYYCTDGKITADLFSSSGKNYVIFTDLFPSIVLSGVKAADLVYANGTWQIFELLAPAASEETFRVSFRKTMLQQLKAKIREM